MGDEDERVEVRMEVRGEVGGEDEENYRDY